MNRWLKLLLRPERGPVLKFWVWLHGWLDPVVARAYLRWPRSRLAVMGIPIDVIGGDEVEVRARIAQVFAYVARSPRHLLRVRRTLNIIGVGAPSIRHGRYVPELRACNLAVHELQVDSIPALAATLIRVVTEARVRHAVFDRRSATPDEWRRLPLLCARAATDFLDRTQHSAHALAPPGESPAP